LLFVCSATFTAVTGEDHTSYYFTGDSSSQFVVDSSSALAPSAIADSSCDLEPSACEGCGDAAYTCLDPWSFAFLQTVEYGTSLALPIALTPQNVVTPVFRDDFQFQTTARLQRQWALAADESFIVGTGYYQNLHPQVNQLDLISPSAFAQYNRRLSDRTIGSLDYNYSYYFLNGDSFINQNRVGGSVLVRENDWWDWKVRADYSNANFRTTDLLDSDNYSGQIEFIRYASSDRTNYFTAGYGAGISNAALDGFSYRLHSVFLGNRWALDECNLDDFRLIAAFSIYDFDGPDPIQVPILRHDEIFTINATYTRTLTDYWKSFASYTYLNSDSNVVRQLYHQNVVALGVSAVW
jgi:hypothetical protein